MHSTSFDAALAAKIDHTLLRPDAREIDVQRLCDEARAFGFASVCVNPSWVRLCHVNLRDSASRVCTVIGFPLGCNRTEVKVRETELALRDGAGEVDMVLHIGRLTQGDTAYVEQDIAAVARAVKNESEDAILKVILEISMLTVQEIETACRIAVATEVDFVKTSTGFGGGGATPEAVTLMRRIVGADIGVKASGGIRTRADALKMIEAGANRIGASASIAIVRT
ncbi:MAG: deoxyribose-phosphate aldolase [Bacteroidota bacterium]|jgi:deoxyribose-phosphate aldolase|nr:deoxyribose-phosphate aldolase [Bacteroidota bacterium]